MSMLEELHADGLIEPVEADESTIGQWLGDAERHLAAAEAISELDPAGAYVLAYDAARKSVAAVLLQSGFRVRARPGSHQALARFARDLGERHGEASLTRLDRLRRNRNRAEYGSRTFGADEVAEAITTARAIAVTCRTLG